MSGKGMRRNHYGTRHRGHKPPHVYRYCRHEWVVQHDPNGDWEYCKKCNKARATSKHR